VLLRYRVLIVVLGFLFAVKEVYDVMRTPHYYSTDADFMAQGAKGQSQISGIARQFGINLGGEGGDTPQFYMDLINSRSILGEVVKKEYELKTDSGVFRGNLIELFGSRTLKPRERLPVAIEHLKKQINVVSSPKTGVMTLTVNASTPEMAVQIANNILVQINAFNLSRRQQQASAERAFAEKTQGEAQAELRAAEANLEAFLMQNRDFARSPALQIEYGRLMRTVEMRQSLFTSLAGSYEQAKIEEVRDLPVITVLAAPEPPLMPESRRGIRRVMLALFLGLGIGALIAFARTGIAASTRGHPGDLAEFEELKRETIADLKRPWRPVVRLFTRGKRRHAVA